MHMIITLACMSDVYTFSVKCKNTILFAAIN